MKRKTISFPIADLQHIKAQMLNWVHRFNICCLLDNNSYRLPHSTHEMLVAAGAHSVCTAAAGQAFQTLRTFSDSYPNEWIFGHFGYDLKNETEALTSSHPDALNFPDLFFFVPEILIEVSATEMSISLFTDDHEEVLHAILTAERQIQQQLSPPTISGRYSRKAYLDVVSRLQQHILRGDCYEVNLCQEFFTVAAAIDPMYVYRSLSRHSPGPYSAFYRLDHLYAISSSPERYLKKTGSRLVSQPMKGTAARHLSDPILDQAAATSLRDNPKERSENIMVVDLVRNDLSRICTEGSVVVEELCGIHTFPHVHQMVSTVAGMLRSGVHWTDAISRTFPMGSMTGAPKKKVMELIERYELSRRGLFSGAVGYVDPAGDFDFSVVIRTLLYNAGTHYLSFQTGSAITFNSDPEKEYEECLLKAGTIKKALAETSAFH